MKVDLSFPPKPHVSVEAKNLICRVSLVINIYKYLYGQKGDLMIIIVINVEICAASGEGFFKKALSSEDHGASLDNQERKSNGYLLQIAGGIPTVSNICAKINRHWIS